MATCRDHFMSAAKRRLAANEADREVMRVIREQMLELAPRSR